MSARHLESRYFKSPSDEALNALFGNKSAYPEAKHREGGSRWAEFDSEPTSVTTPDLPTGESK